MKGSQTLIGVDIYRVIGVDTVLGHGELYGTNNVEILTEILDTAVQSDRLTLQHLVGPGLTAEVRAGECLHTTAGVSDTFTTGGVNYFQLSSVPHLLHLDIFWPRKVEKKTSSFRNYWAMNG